MKGTSVVSSVKYVVQEKALQTSCYVIAGEVLNQMVKNAVFFFNYVWNLYLVVGWEMRGHTATFFWLHLVI